MSWLSPTRRANLTIRRDTGAAATDCKTKSGDSSPVEYLQLFGAIDFGQSLWYLCHKDGHLGENRVFQIIAEHTDWRLLDELKRELKA